MITETYRDIEIVLMETENIWKFTANGRERKAPSLPKAREFIDNALDKVDAKTEKKWEPIDCYRLDTYSTSIDGLEKGRITSVAENDYRGIPQVWFTGEKNGRRKISVDQCCAASPENDQVLERLREIEKQQETLDRQFREAAKQIKRVELPSQI